MSQKKREYITDLLASIGSPPPGHIYTVQEGASRELITSTPLDPIFQPESAVVHLIPKGGEWMDGQCYDAQGYQVYAD